MTNPLVAEKQDSTSAISGITFLEGGKAIKDGIESGSWASVAMGAVGVGMDAIAFVADPFGSILAAGVGWLMEHVGPLKEALDKLAGDPDQITALSETWKNIAKEVGAVSTDLANQVKADVQSWTGPGADAYRSQAEEVAKTLEGTAQACEGASSGVKTAGEVVAAVRMLVRDIIAQVVGHMISWALQVLFTLGIGMAWVLPQVVNLVAKTAKQIAELIKSLTKALKALAELMGKAGKLFADAGKALKGLKPGAKAKPGDVEIKPAGAKDGGTTPSSAPKDGGGGTPKDGDTSPQSAPKDGPEGTAPKDGDTSPQSAPRDGTDSAGGAGKNDPAKEKSPEEKPDCLDPIDVATGDVFMTECDLTVPGALGDLLVRNHVSSYRDGRWFGPSWASLVDERLEISGGVVRYYSADAMVLTFRLPGPGTPAVNANGPYRSLSADGEGFVLTDPARNSSRRFLPHPEHRNTLLLKEIRSEDGESVEVSHDRSGSPAQVVHSGGARLAFDVSEGRVRAVHALGDSAVVPVARYEYDDNGHLSARYDSFSHPARYEHDPVGRLLGWTDNVGSWYRYGYDGQGRAVRTTGDRGYLDGTLAYGDGTTTVTDSLGHRTVFEFDEAGNVVTETDKLGGVTRSEWGPHNRLAARTDPLGRRTSFEHDAAGLLRAVVRPDGTRVEILSRTAAELEIGVRAGDRLLRRTYTAPVLPDPYTDPLGASSDLDPEPAPADKPGLPDPADRDMFGRPRTAPGAGGNRSQLVWTVEGALRAVVGPGGVREEWSFDAAGNPLSHKDTLDRVTSTEYGPFGLELASVDAAGARTVRRFDTELRLTAVTNPAGQTWEYTLDAEGRILAESDFAGRVTRFAYDAAGQLVESVNAAGERIAYGYDAIGNLVRRESGAGAETYVYDAVGHLVRASGPGVVLEYEHDEAGRVTSQTTNGRTTSFAYEGESAVVRTTPSGMDIAWRRDTDAADALTVAGSDLVLRRDGAGRLAELATEQKLLLRQEFGPEGRLAAQHTSGGTRRYHRRVDGSVAAREDATGGARYERDTLGRVTAVHLPGGTDNYGYDVLGDLVTSSPGTGFEAGTRQYAGGMPRVAGSVRYEHDAQGRLTERTVTSGDGAALTWTFRWDPYDQLVGVTTPEGTRWRYVYDPLGRRIAKERLDPAGTVAARTDFVWDGNHLVEAHESGGETLTWVYHPDDERPVVQATTGAAGVRVRAVVTDAVGTPVEFVDPDGASRAFPMSLWGLTRAGDGEVTPLRFPGQYYDAETGLHYNVNRYYDPGNGRYISPDPLGLDPAPNPRTYVGDPLLEHDMLGLTSSGGGGFDAGDYRRFSSRSRRSCSDAFGKSTGGSSSAAPRRGRTSGGSSSTRPRPGGKEWDAPSRDSAPDPITGLSARDRDPHSGRTGGQGGGRDSGTQVLDGSTPGRGQTPRTGHNTDVPQLNDASAKGNLSQELKDELGDPRVRGGLNEGWIKGHLHNEELGGPGTWDNLTPLTHTANMRMKGNFEQPLKNTNTVISQLKRFRISDASLARRGYSSSDIKAINRDIDNLSVSFRVRSSDDVKFPNSSNGFERSIRDHVDMRSQLNMSPALRNFMQNEDPTRLANLDNAFPGSMKMDTITGQIF